MRLGFPFVGREPGDLAGIRSSSSRPALPTRRKEGAGLERGSLTPEMLLAKAAHENFPVALRLLPRSVRRHLMAIYGFARLVDDIGDEASGNRLAQLDADIDRIYRGEAPKHPLLAEIATTVRAFGVPPEPLRRLVRANRQDQTVRRYGDLAGLVRYCELSANPVGHLVLYVFGSATPERLALSDSICTGLQLVEHWQDVAEDLARDRIYLPQEDLARFGVDERDLAAASAGGPVRRLMEFEVSRAGNMLSEGAPLIATLHGWARSAAPRWRRSSRRSMTYCPTPPSRHADGWPASCRPSSCGRDERRGRPGRIPPLRRRHPQPGPEFLLRDPAAATRQAQRALRRLRLRQAGGRRRRRPAGAAGQARSPRHGQGGAGAARPPPRPGAGGARRRLATLPTSAQGLR